MCSAKQIQELQTLTNIIPHFFNEKPKKKKNTANLPKILQNAKLSRHSAPVIKTWIMNNSIGMRCKLVESGTNSSGRTFLLHFYSAKSFVPNITNEKSYPNNLFSKSIIIYFVNMVGQPNWKLIADLLMRSLWLK